MACVVTGLVVSLGETCLPSRRSKAATTRAGRLS